MIIIMTIIVMIVMIIVTIMALSESFPNLYQILSKLGTFRHATTSETERESFHEWTIFLIELLVPSYQIMSSVLMLIVYIVV